MKIAVNTLSWTGEVDLDPKSTLEDVKKVLSPLLGIPASKMSVLCGATLWSDPEATAEAELKDIGTLTVVRSDGWGASRLENLKAKFLKNGKVEETSQGCLAFDASLPDGLELPEPLAALLRLGAHWTYKDLFHLEIFVGDDGQNLGIFGDEECRQDWAQEHGDESCAGKDWYCLGCSSEYDYYFVNLRKDSANYGAVKHIVNNCDEERLFTEPPLDNFLDAVERYVLDRADKDKDGKDGGSDEDEDSEDQRLFTEYDVLHGGKRKKPRGEEA